MRTDSDTLDLTALRAYHADAAMLRTDDQNVADFRRTLRNLQSLLYRLDHGLTGTRNRTPDPRAYAAKLQALVGVSDAVCDLLDANARLALSYNAAERRAYGLEP